MVGPGIQAFNASQGVASIHRTNYSFFILNNMFHSRTSKNEQHFKTRQDGTEPKVILNV